MTDHPAEEPDWLFTPDETDDAPAPAPAPRRRADYQENTPPCEACQ